MSSVEAVVSTTGSSDREGFCEREFPRLVRSLTAYTGRHDLAQEALARA